MLKWLKRRKAKARYIAALQERANAVAARDTRRQHKAQKRLKTALHDLMRAGG